jgi:hypothetical protein
MKKVLLLIMAVVLLASGVSQAGIYNFVPPQSDLRDLPHSQYVTWGLNWTHRTEHITDAVLTFHNIWNWRHEANNLYSHLLDNVPLGTRYRNDTRGGDNFAGQGQLIGNWTDAVGGHARNFDLTYRFSSLGLVSALNTYAADGRFGFGFDPDCHYYNRGVTLQIITADNPPNHPPVQTPVPEPASMLLFGLGIAGAAIVRRFKK